MPSDPRERYAHVIDLPAFAEPVAQLLDFYDRMADLTRDEPPIEELEAILRSLQALPEPGGRLGDDLAIIRMFRPESTRAEILNALGRLRRVAAMDHNRQAGPSGG